MLRIASKTRIHAQLYFLFEYDCWKMMNFFLVKEDEKALLLNEIRIFFRVDWWGECCTLAVSKSDCPMKLVCYDDGLGLHVSHFLQSSPGISIKIFTVPCFTGFLFHHLHAAPNFFNLSAGWHLVLYLDFPNALTHVFF